MNASDLKIITLGMGTPGIEEPQLMGLGISPNGRYVCGSIEMGSGYFVGDLQSDTYIFETTDDPEGAELRHIDNNGVAIGYCGPGITFSFADSKQTILETPSEGEWKYVLGEAISNDGSLLVGSLVAKGYKTFGAYSKDGGEWTTLPMPEADKLGPYADEGTSAKFVSGDGKYILGSTGNNMGCATLWVRNDAGEYEADPFYYDFVVMTEEDKENGEKKLMGLAPICISNSGEYVLCNGTVEVEEGYTLVPVVYNTVSRSITIYDEPQEIDTENYGLFCSAIDDNGTFIGIVGQMPILMSKGCFIMKAGETQAKSFTEEFPDFADAFGFSDSVGYVVPTGLSADGSKIIGYGYYSEDFFDDDTPAYFTTFIIDATSGGQSGIESVEPSTDACPEAIYSITGQRLRELTPGINIIRMSDGTVRKVMK